MKTKNLTTLIIILAIAALLALMFNGLRNRNIKVIGDGTNKQRLIPGFPVNDVAKLIIQQKDGSLTLNRKDAVWSVSERNNYPADFSKVAELLRTVFDLSPVQTVVVGPSKFGRVGLLAPGSEDSEAEQSATVLSFQSEQGKDIGALWLGKEYKRKESRMGSSFDQAAGRYVKLPDSETVYLVADQFSDAGIEPDEWLKKNPFFQVKKVKTIERIPEDAAQGWKLTRESDTRDFVLADAKAGEELDSSKVGSMKSAFANPGFEDVETGQDVEAPSKVTFKIETFEGFRYEIKVSEKDDENEYLMSVKTTGKFPKEREPAEGESAEEKKTKDDEYKNELRERRKRLAQEKELDGHIYRVRGYVADSVNKDRSEILKEKEQAKEEDKDAASLPGLDTKLPGLGN